MKEKVYISCIILMSIGGIYFTSLSANYVYNFFTDIEATAKHEYAGGAILSAIIALPFWLVISGFVYLLRKTVSKELFWVLNTPSIILGTGFIMMNIYILFMAVFDKLKTI